MNTPPKVSIIVPIYNAGVYLKPCLDTLVNQTMKEIEIILVLDCPTDGSDAVANEYGARDSRIKIIANKKNLHIGLSRNEGLKHATGEYVAFSDHDDCRELDMYENLHREAEDSRADIVFSKVAELRAEGVKVWEIPHVRQRQLKDYVFSNLVGRGNYEHGSSWFCNIHNSLYRRSLLSDNKICFVDTSNITPEDVLFNIRSVYFASTVIYVDRPYYYHRILDESEGHTYGYGNWAKRTNGLLSLYEFLCDEGCYRTYEVNFLLYVRRELLNSLLGILVRKRGMREFFMALRHMKTYPFIRKAFYFYSKDDNITLKNPLKRLLRRMIASYLATLDEREF